jgi:hypothetical protein
VPKACLLDRPAPPVAASSHGVRICGAVEMPLIVVVAACSGRDGRSSNRAPLYLALRRPVRATNRAHGLAGAHTDSGEELSPR